MKLKVNEIFYSLQGEGSRAGEPSIFIRLSDCNLSCGFCDTEFESGKEMTVEEIEQYLINKFFIINGEQVLPWNKLWIVWTGGEPALQLTNEIINWFSLKGFKQAIETSGSCKVPLNLDLITLSPKVAEHVLAKNFKEFTEKIEDDATCYPGGNNYPTELELKYVWHSGKSDIPKPVLYAKHYFLSPIFEGNKPNMENIKHCIKLCLENPRWKLSIQIHKLLNIL